MSGCAIGGVATASAVLPDWVRVVVLVSGDVERVVSVGDVLVVPEAVPAVEPLTVPEPPAVSRVEDRSVVPLCALDCVELEGGGNVTVADESFPDVDDDDGFWLEPDCACNASVAANNAPMLVLTNLRGIFIAYVI